MRTTDPSPTPSPLARTTRWRTRFVMSLVALAMALRLAMFLTTGERPAAEDHAIARHLVDGQGFAVTEFGYTGPTSVRPPVYPMLLATLYAFLPPERADAIAIGLNACFGAASVGFAYLLARRLNASGAGAIAFALLVAIWPTQLVAATYAQGLALAVLLLLATLWLATFSDPRIAILAGLGASAAVLTESVLVLPLLLAIVWLTRRNPAYTALTIAAAITLVGPWLYRNAIVHGRFVGITTSLWSDVFQGNGDNATGSHLPTSPTSDQPVARVRQVSPRQADQLQRQPEAARESLLRRWSLDWIAEHPARYIELCGVRVLKTLWTDWHHPLGLHWANVASRSIACIGFLAAIAIGVRSPNPSLRVAVPLLIGLLLASGLTLAEARNAVFVDVAQLLPIAWWARGRTA